MGIYDKNTIKWRLTNILLDRPHRNKDPVAGILLMVIISTKSY